MKVAEQSFSQNKAASYPEFKAGDTITVTYKIKEGDKFRLQNFRGVVIQICGATPFTRTFTVRKVSGGIGVERIFPYESPFTTRLSSTRSVRSAELASSTSAISQVRRLASRRRSSSRRTKYIGLRT